MNASSEFEWDKDSTIIQQVDAVAVYRNPDGDIVIRQRDSMQDEDHVVIVPMQYAPAIIAALQRHIDEAS